jgi:hypothetical protein
MLSHAAHTAPAEHAPFSGARGIVIVYKGGEEDKDAQETVRSESLILR